MEEAVDLSLMQMECGRNKSSLWGSTLPGGSELLKKPGSPGNSGPFSDCPFPYRCWTLITSDAYQNKPAHMINRYPPSCRDPSSSDKILNVSPGTMGYRPIHCPVGTGLGSSANESRVGVGDALPGPIGVTPVTCTVPKESGKHSVPNGSLGHQHPSPKMCNSKRKTKKKTKQNNKIKQPCFLGTNFNKPSEQKYRTIKSRKNSLARELISKRAEKRLDQRRKYSLIIGAEDTA